VPQIVLQDDHIDGGIMHSAYERWSHVFFASKLHLIVLKCVELKGEKKGRLPLAFSLYMLWVFFHVRKQHLPTGSA